MRWRCALSGLSHIYMPFELMLHTKPSCPPGTHLNLVQRTEAGLQAPYSLFSPCLLAYPSALAHARTPLGHHLLPLPTAAPAATTICATWLPVAPPHSRCSGSRRPRWSGRALPRGSGLMRSPPATGWRAKRSLTTRRLSTPPPPLALAVALAAAVVVAAVGRSGRTFCRWTSCLQRTS